MSRSKKRRYAVKSLSIHISFDKRTDGHIDIRIKSLQRKIFSGSTTISEASLNDISDRLIEQLEVAVERSKDGAGIDSIRTLARYGQESLDLILGNATRENEEKWRHLVGSIIDLRHAIANVKFSRGFFFPVGLLYAGNAESSSFEGLVSGFLGSKFVILNSLELNEEREGLEDWLSSSNMCTILIGIDDSLVGVKDEIRCLQGQQGVNSFLCKSKADLIRSWKENPDDKTMPDIIHFSTHHKYSENEKDYIITLSDGENFRALKDRRMLPKGNAELPLIFFNSCKVGNVRAANRENFIASLCPRYCIGFLSTISDIKSQYASRFACDFYSCLFDLEFVVDSLATVKYSHLNRNKNIGALTYEFWEIPETLSLHKPIYNGGTGK